MYGLAYKHINLFKQIPFCEFSVNGDFIEKVVTNPEEYGTYANILKCYYFISDEIWDFEHIKPLIQFDSKRGVYHFYDFVKKRSEFIKSKRYKQIKLFNGVLDKNGTNRNWKKQHCLIVQRNHGARKPDVKRLKNDLIEYSYVYNQNLKFYQRNKFDIPEEWAEHLYKIMKQLSNKATFFYKQRGSFILSQEMANVLSNQSIFVYSSNLINKLGYNRKKVIRQIKEQKQFMFGEIKHNYR